MKEENVASLMQADERMRLRQVDSERYQASLLAGFPMRDYIGILYGLHYELASIPRRVSDQMVASVRYQWWRDIVARIYAGEVVQAGSSSELAQALAGMVRAVDMPRFWVDRLISVYAENSSRTAFADMAAVQLYCAQSSGLLVQMALRCVGVRDVLAGQDFGTAWGLTQLARSWAYEYEDRLSAINFADLCGRAWQTYLTAKAELNPVSVQAIPALAYGILIPDFLQRLQAGDHDPAVRIVSVSPLTKRFKFMQAALTGCI